MKQNFSSASNNTGSANKEISPPMELESLLKHTQAHIADPDLQPDETSLLLTNFHEDPL
jgi:hypothetical protein